MFRAWQLLPRPKSLEEFNSLPFLTSNFFQANISILLQKCDGHFFADVAILLNFEYVWLQNR
jgi:hypothetical protein